MKYLIVAFALCLAVLNQQAFAAAKKSIAKMAPSAVVLAVDEKGKTLLAQNADKPFVPASVAKVVTAWLAMKELGGDYRFKTSFFFDKDRVLYVKGGGDPFLVSEEIVLLAPEVLKAIKNQPIKKIVIDTSYYPADLRIPGIEQDSEAYNALNAALAANFNTINARRKGKRVVSAEKQTPITPTAIKQFKARGPKKGKGRISLAQQNPKIGVIYAGELIAEFIKRSGGKVEGSVTIGKLPEGLSPVYVHAQSRPLSKILKLMLYSSNNYITNQVFLEIGAHRFGGPVSLEKSLRVARENLKKIGLSDKDIKLEEGSGISRGNRFTAAGLATVLADFKENQTLLKKGRSGARYKTGTLSGVRTLTGYTNTKSHKNVRYVISIRGNTGRLRYQILRALQKGL